MKAYYNELDPVAAQWLRNLIAAGHIAPGVVDERSVEDVRPDELAGYVQCHFFAGIGVWSYALRRAGWPDDRPVWTGSCPCQPFSAAGEGAGFADERHLWPAFFHLIRECRPAIVLGEQVASKDAEPWIDLVCADLGSLGYASGAVAFPSASVGAPHIRDRLYWAGVALGDTERAGLAQRIGLAGVPGRASRADARQAPERAGVYALRLAGTDGGNASAERQQPGWQHGQQPQDGGPVRLGDAERIGPQGSGDAGGSEGVGQARTQPAGAGADGGMAHDASSGRREERADPGRGADGDRAQGIAAGPGTSGSDSRPGPVNGFWRDADWLLCRPEPGYPRGRWRPVEPSTFPLAHGAPARMGRLRAYGNAINAEAARVFIEAVKDAA